MLPKNMGRVHRLAYAAIGVAALAYALLASSSGVLLRTAAAAVGVSALFSSFVGYCVTCHVLRVNTRANRAQRFP